MTPLSLTHQNVAGGVLVTVTGEVDATNADRLEAYLSEVRAPGQNVILDLSGLTFMDSRGLHVLLRLHGAVRTQQARLSLAAVHDWPARLLQITGIWDALDIHPGVEEAIQAAEDEQAHRQREPS
jgi:anti-anti-sigma factor